MAFVRRKGNTYYLVHNVRREGKVKQIHLASLGETPRITDAVMRQVAKKHPFVDLDWRALREQVNHRVDLYDLDSPGVKKLIASLQALTLNLADLFPPLLRVVKSPQTGQEILTQLRLLQSTIQVKLDQFDRSPLAIPQFRNR
ncbi:MAG: hypothetical protein ABSF92_02690 [Candidatus Acidiferrales bacterium]|jgi:hypothetical protein